MYGPLWRVQFQLFEKLTSRNWTSKIVWLLINNINKKNSRRGSSTKIFRETIFSHSRKLFSKVSVQNFYHRFTRYHWLSKFPIVFPPIMIENRVIFFLYILFISKSWINAGRIRLCSLWILFPSKLASSSGQKTNSRLSILRGLFSIDLTAGFYIIESAE